jgi:hypothetical protein
MESPQINVLTLLNLWLLFGGGGSGSSSICSNLLASTLRTNVV